MLTITICHSAAGEESHTFIEFLTRHMSIIIIKLILL